MHRHTRFDGDSTIKALQGVNFSWFASLFFYFLLLWFSHAYIGHIVRFCMHFLFPILLPAWSTLCCSIPLPSNQTRCRLSTEKESRFSGACETCGTQLALWNNLQFLQIHVISCGALATASIWCSHALKRLMKSYRYHCLSHNLQQWHHCALKPHDRCFLPTHITEKRVKLNCELNCDFVKFFHLNSL